MKKISTGKAPAAVGPYSQAIVSDGFVFVSGQLGMDASGAFCEGVAAQTENAINNLSAILLAAGSSLDRVVKTTCFLANLQDFASFNQAYDRCFTAKPSRTLIEASALPKGSLVEIDAIAEIGEKEEKI